MKYGKRFKKLQAIHPEFNNLSANRCSQLTYGELRHIAKALYHDHSQQLGADYMRCNHETLASRVYNALNTL